MPKRSEFRLDERPDRPFHEFDELLGALDEIPDLQLREEVADALADRTLDTDWLVEQVPLGLDTIEQLERVQRWGYEDLSVPQPFGSLVIATISGAANAGRVDFVAHIFASREAGRIAYTMVDDADGEAELGDSADPLTLGELLRLVDRVLAENAPWPTEPGDVLAGYFDQDREFDLRVHSKLYPDLERWYREAVHEWLAAHPE